MDAQTRLTRASLFFLISWDLLSQKPEFADRTGETGRFFNGGNVF